MLERFLHQTPFLRFTLPLIIGIIIQDHYACIKIPLFTLLILISIFIIFTDLFKLNQRYSSNRFWGFLVTLFIIIYGMQLVKLKQISAPKLDENKKMTFIGVVIEEPEISGDFVKTILRIQYTKDTVYGKKRNTFALVYFNKDSLSSAFELGDQIIANSFFTEIKNNKNPYAFNYKKFLQYQKDVYYNIYLNSDEYKIIGKNKISLLRALSNKTRHKLLKIIEKNNFSTNEKGILAALTLGYKRNLTPELKESYATSGVIHVLAVSGLHVGILFIILSKLLFFLQKNKLGKIIKIILIILTLLFYSFLTGLSNSVIRASVMFSIICIGNLIDRQSNIYNSIFASAFVMLVCNPYLLMQAGFQLSYVAVISIVFFQPRIYSLIQFNKTATDYIWQLISVTIAAQIGTFPITIHYFNQFPSYFIIANIIAIPLVTVIIYSSIFLYAFSFSSLISLFVSKILNFLIFLLNKSLISIEHLPFSKFDNIFIDKWGVIILYTFIFYLSFFIIKKKLVYFKASILFLSAFFIFNICNHYFCRRDSIFIVHDISGVSGINLIKGNCCNYITNHKMESIEKDFNYKVRPILLKQGIKKIKISYNDKSDFFNFYMLKNKRIIQLKDNTLLNFETDKKLKIDYIVLSEDINIRINKLSTYFDFETLIFDSSNSYYRSDSWEKECKETGIKFYNVNKRGAFIKYF